MMIIQEIKDRKHSVKALNYLHEQFYILVTSDFINRNKERKTLVGLITKLLEKLDYQLDPR